MSHKYEKWEKRLSLFLEKNKQIYSQVRQVNKNVEKHTESTCFLYAFKRSTKLYQFIVFLVSVMMWFDQVGPYSVFEIARETCDFGKK